MDDDEGARCSAVALLRLRNIRATTVPNGAEAVIRLLSNRFDLVLTDLQMPEMTGIELLEWIRENHSGVPVVLVTGALTAAVARSAIESGAAAVLSKPFNSAEFFAVLDEVFPRSRPLPV